MQFFFTIVAIMLLFPFLKILYSMSLYSVQVWPSGTGKRLSLLGLVRWDFMQFVQEQLILSEAKILNLFQGCKLRYNSSSNLSVISWCHLNPLDPKSKLHPTHRWHNNPTVGSKCWAFVSDCFVAFSWKWHAIYNVCSCYITSSLWSIVCTDSEFSEASNLLITSTALKKKQQQ